MKTIILITAITSIIFNSGCVNRVGDFTVASTKNIKVSEKLLTEGNRVKGSDWRFIPLVPILGVPNMKEAVDEAIETDRCAVGLSDVVVESGWFYLYLGALWYNVEGNLIIDKSKIGCENWISNNKDNG